MSKPKILIAKRIPQECLTPYADAFDFVQPETKQTFTYEEIVSRIGEFDGYLVIDRKADRQLFDAAVKLKVIANVGVGYDHIDWQYATQKGIPVLNTPTQVTEATAELTIGLIIDTMRSIAYYDRLIRAGGWDYSLFSDRSTMIHGSTLGIIGFGRIGKAVCRKAKGLGMEVIYYDLLKADPAEEEACGAAYRPLEQLLAESDCVTLHIPYNPANHHFISAASFRRMKAGAYFINAARGKVVNEQDLIEALRSGSIKGAGLDVFEYEPQVSEALLELDQVVMTPHVGTLTMRSRVGMCREALDGLTEVLRGGKPANTVNPEVFAE